MSSFKVSRRDLLFGAAGAASGLRAATAQQARARRPNILFLMVDEMRWDVMGCAGHPVVRTPNLDRLAREGVRFANAYTSSPVCSPARACLFTGRHAHVHGVTTNAVPAHNGEMFLPSILRHYGYHTAISGKLHFVPARFDFGFDQFWSFSSEGPTPEKGYNAYLRGKHGSPGKFPIVPGTAPWPDDPLGRDVGEFRYPEEDFETTWITDRAVEYVRSRKDTAQPWFLFTSYLDPHSPSVQPKRYLNMYDPAKVPVPKLPPDIAKIRGAEEGRGQRRFIADEKMLRVMTAAYYGAVTQVDDQIGRLLGELERLGMADNTMIVFTTDHGNMLGDRGRWFKGVMYEGSARAPLLWRGPGGAKENRGRVEEKLVDHTDVMPSILEAAGLPAAAGIQGRSFLKLVRDGDPRWEDRCYSQLRSAMVRTPEWKFIDNSLDLSGPFELYDMRRDPKEERNLADETRNRALAADFRRELTAWRADRPAPVKIAGMAAPAYASISAEERTALMRNAPDNRER